MGHEMPVSQAVATGKAIGVVYNAGSRAGLVRFVVVMAWLPDAIVVYDPSAKRFPWSRYALKLTRFLSWADAPEMTERAVRAWPGVRGRLLGPAQVLWEYGKPFPASLVTGSLKPATTAVRA